MSGQLLTHGDGDARCISCGGPAVGPCARCRRPICGDCCVLTTGGMERFAICLPCERRDGASLSPGWQRVISWVMFPIVALLALVVLLEWLIHR